MTDYKVLTIEVQVNGSEEEIKKEIDLILRLINASEFSRVIGIGINYGRASTGLRL